MSTSTFTFKQFYEEKVGSEFSDRVLKQVFVGQTKEGLDLVDYDLVVAEVLSVFGRYVKYNVEKEASVQGPHFPQKKNRNLINLMHMPRNWYKLKRLQMT